MAVKSQSKGLDEARRRRQEEIEAGQRLHTLAYHLRRIGVEASKPPVVAPPPVEPEKEPYVSPRARAFIEQRERKAQLPVTPSPVVSTQFPEPSEVPIPIEEDTPEALLKRVYPDVEGLTVEEFDRMVNFNLDDVLQDLITRGRTEDSDILLESFGFSIEAVDELYNQNFVPPKPPAKNVASTKEELNSAPSLGTWREWEGVVYAPGVPVPVTFWEDPVEWWNQYTEKYQGRAEADKQVAVIRQATLANTPGIVGLVNTPMWENGLNANDLVGLALLGYGTYQTAQVGWDFFLRSYARFEFASRATTTIPKKEMNAAINWVMSNVSRKWLSQQAIRSIFRRADGGLKASTDIVSQVQTEVTALVNRGTPILLPQFTQTLAQEPSPILANVVSKIISRTPLTPEEAQFRMNNVAAVEEALAVRPVEPEVVPATVPEAPPQAEAIPVAPEVTPAPKEAVTPTTEAGVVAKDRNIRWNVTTDTGLASVSVTAEGKYQFTPAYPSTARKVFDNFDDAIAELGKLGNIEQLDMVAKTRVPFKPTKLEVGSTAELGLKQGERFTDDFGNDFIMAKTGFKLDTVVKGQRISIMARKEAGWEGKRASSLAKLQELEPKEAVTPTTEAKVTPPVEAPMVEVPTEVEVKQTEFIKDYAETKGQPPPPPPIEPPPVTTQFPSDMPASQQVANRISFDPDKVSLRERFLRGKNKAMSQWIDKLHPIDTFVSEAKKLGSDISMEENPYIQARLLEGVTSKATTFIEQGTFSRKFWKMERGKAVPDFKGESLSNILESVKSPQAWRDFSTYLTSLRAKELDALGIETGIEADIADRAITELESKYPNFPKLSDKIQKYQSEMLDYVQESGLIGPELRKKLDTKYISYVPFHRVMEELQGKGYMGKKMVDIASPVKRIKGSEREIINPLESIVKNTYAFVSAADRNQVGVAMARLVNEHPELQGLFEPIKTPISKVAQVTAKELGIDVEGLSDDIVEGVFDVFRPSMFTKDNVATVMIEGKKNFFKVDPDLNTALTTMDTANMGVLWKVLSAPAKWLRAGATLSPDFMIRNPLRDQMSALIYSNYGFIPGVDFLRGVASILRKDGTYRLYKLSGAEHSMLVSLDRDYLQTSFKEVVEGKKFTNYVKHPLGLLQILSELGEKATRLGEFNRGIKSGATPIEAGFSSREVTLDFAKAGTQAKALNQIIAFFNANIRDPDRMISSFRDHPTRTAVKIFLFITIPSILLWAVNKDDERWNEIPQWQKDTFWIIMTENNIYRIPKPFGLGQIFGSAPERLLDHLDSKDPTIGKKFAENLFQTTLPGWLPSGIEPIIENITNHNFFRGTPVVPRSLADLPPELQYTEYTSEVAKGMGRLLNVPPMKVDNILSGWTAGLGRYATEGIDKILEGTGIVAPKIEPSPTMSDLPVVRAFSVRNPIGGSSASVETFYDELSRYTSLEKLLKGLITDGKQSDFEKEKAKYPELLFAYDETTDAFYSASARYLRRVSGELSDIRKLQNKIYKSTTMTSEQKRSLITELDVVKTELAKRALELIKNPSKEVGILDTPVEEIESKLGTSAGDPIITDTVKMSDIGSELGQAKGESPLKSLFEENKSILADIANLPDTPLYKIDRATTKAGLTRRQNELLNQYDIAEDKGAFIEENPELKENPKVKKLRDNPRLNAVLALWGNAKLLTQESYNIAIELMGNNDIPDDTLEKRILPPKGLVEPYFELSDSNEEFGSNSWESKLVLAKFPKLAGFLGLDVPKSPVEALELKTKHREAFDLEEQLKDSENTEMYIKDPEERDAKLRELLGDEEYQLFADDWRRVKAIENNGSEFQEEWVVRGQTIDEFESNSYESLLWNLDNPEAYDWAIANGLLTDRKAEMAEREVVIRLNNEFAEGIDHIKELTEEQRADYLANPLHEDLRKAVRKIEGYSHRKYLTVSQIDKFVEYHEQPLKGKRRDRMLLEDSAFALAMFNAGIITVVPDKVPNVKYDDLYDQFQEDFDRIEEGGLSKEERLAMRVNSNGTPTEFGIAEKEREAYGKYIPDNQVANYVTWYTDPKLNKPVGHPVSEFYEDDWFMMENPDFYKDVYLGVLGNERLDFRNVPTRKVFSQYVDYSGKYGNKDRLWYRFNLWYIQSDREFERWLLRTGKVTKSMGEYIDEGSLTGEEYKIYLGPQTEAQRAQAVSDETRDILDRLLRETR